MHDLVCLLFNFEINIFEYFYVNNQTFFEKYFVLFKTGFITEDL